MNDIVFVGAGLASCLTALAIKKKSPDRRILMLDSKSDFTRTQTWSFHTHDVPKWVLSYANHTWSSYRVKFLDSERVFQSGYHTFFSDELLRQTARVCDVRFSADVSVLNEKNIRLTSGETIDAKLVIDGRGQDMAAPHKHVSFQKFFGLVLEWDKPHNVLQPLLMDASVPQVDGFEFVYTLPFSAHQVLVEWTCYSNSPSIDEASARVRIRSYVENQLKQDFQSAREIHFERAALPLARVAADAEHVQNGVPKIGVAAGFYHLTTGYSVPNAARVAETIAHLPTLDSRSICTELNSLAQSHKSQRTFEALLNRMMFQASDDSKRWKVFSRFYKLDEPLIERFYSGVSTGLDKFKILTGKPPVPVFKALKATFKAKDVTCTT